MVDDCCSSACVVDGAALDEVLGAADDEDAGVEDEEDDEDDEDAPVKQLASPLS